MDDHVYKKVEITGTSRKSSDDAVANAIQRASETIQNLRWFEVIETRGDIDGNGVGRWQVTVKIGFRLER